MRPRGGLRLKILLYKTMTTNTKPVKGPWKFAKSTGRTVLLRVCLELIGSLALLYVFFHYDADLPVVVMPLRNLLQVISLVEFGLVALILGAILPFGKTSRDGVFWVGVALAVIGGLWIML